MSAREIETQRKCGTCAREARPTCPGIACLTALYPYWVQRADAPAAAQEALGAAIDPAAIPAQPEAGVRAQAGLANFMQMDADTQHRAETFGPLEADPHGKSQHEAGAKLDAGKLRTGLVLGGFSRALAAVAAVGTFGAAKYTANGWVQVPNGVERYTDAMWRHLLTEAAGEAKDKDSGLAHAAHAAWNALARLDLLLRAEDQRREAA